MDSTITHGYENQETVVDVNKQAYSPTMNFQQQNFTDNQVSSENFHISGDPYNVPYENPSQENLENLAPQNYYSTPDVQFQGAYIPEHSPVVDTRNNSINPEPTEEFGETQEGHTPSEHYSSTANVAEGGDVVADDTTTTGHVQDGVEITEIEGDTPETGDSIPVIDLESGETAPDSSKMEYSDIPHEEVVPQSQNGDNEETTNENAEFIQENTTASDMNTHGDHEVKEEVMTAADPISSNQDTTMEGEVIMEAVEETALVEPEEHPQLAELTTYEPQQAEYTIVEEKIHSDVTSAPNDSAPVEEHDYDLMEGLIREEEQAAEIPQRTEVKQRRTRKPVYDVPMHLLGHNIEKPVDPVPNGRSLPKPRLGVKVPYRNLTSQIVSKAELEEVILERSRAKEEAASKGDVKFARSLTQRLAKKIIPETKSKKQKEKRSDPLEQHVEQIENMATEETGASTNSGVSTNTGVSADDSKIQNDDDLLAILEGEGDEIPELTKEIADSQADDSNLKLLEREIALQQLQELPHQEPKERIMKPRYAKSTPPIKVENSSKIKTQKSSSSQKPSHSPSKSNTSIASSKTTTSHPSPKSTTSHSPPKSSTSHPPPLSPKKTDTDLDPLSPVKKPIEIEPQVKVNMVLKTYSRKRKPSEIADYDIPSPKRPYFDDSEIADLIDEKIDPLALPTDVYVTKSSRVIKKKVIWDPDDDQPFRVTKPVATKVNETAKIPPAKVIKPTPTPEKKPADKPASDKPKEQKVVVRVAEKTNDKITPKKVVTKKSPGNKAKRGLSEVDRLLMDEGAVKMLYDLKGEDSAPGKKKKDVYSVEKAEKDIIKKANLLKNDLVLNTSNESPKSLRKKEGPSPSPVVISPLVKPTQILERKLSKDSTRSSVVTPPRSPTFQFSSQSSMLIRRRSSSSMSSEDLDEEHQRMTKSSKKLEGSKSKKQKKNISAAADKKEAKENEKSPSKETLSKVVKGTQYKSLRLKKSGKHVTIDLNYIEDKCFFTITVLDELISALKKLEKDKDCSVVSLTSSNKSFSLGLDYKFLMASENKETLNKATELAKKVREFLLALLRFPKVLVAGIQGDCVGLAVTMLPLFDAVIASDTATFSTPYANLGCLGEATFLLTYPNISSGLATDLLYANQALKADEAFKRGLISKLCWPEKYKNTLNDFLNSIAKGSQQSLETTKRQLRVNIKNDIEAAINKEMDILIQHWTSPECQEQFSKLGQ